uniref:Uncharacterized protein n=2 Tax=Oryza TaxID=4527 RepID=A0A0D3GG18_9ORYZ
MVEEPCTSALAAGVGEVDSGLCDDDDDDDGSCDNDGMWICGICGFGILREILNWEHEFG